MKKTILILGIIAVFFASCKRDEMLEEGDKWHSGHAAVDLGLPSGLYWATCDMGATSPEEDGHFFAWGEVNPKTMSSEENSETNNKNLGDISGDAQYDAARANWDGYWRVPTKYEMQELVEHCSWEKETLNGVDGYRVTGPSGNSIFMKGSYWTSSPYKEAVYISTPPIYNHNEAYMLGDNGDVFIFSAHRTNLNNVRPVFCKLENPKGFDAISESVNDVTAKTASFNAMVMQDEPSTIKTYGVCWSTNARLTIDDDCDTRYEYLDPENHGNCFYTTYLENLQPNTKYYIRAFATHGDAVVYGEIMSFTTLDEEPETPNVPEEPGESGGFITTKCILLENYRGVRCNNCPAADEIALNIQKQYGHSVVVLGVHSGFLSAPVGGYPNFKTAEGDAWYSFFGFDSNPIGTVNRKSDGGVYAFPSTDWADAVASALQEESAVGMASNVEYDEATRNLKVDVTSKALVELPDTYSLTVCIMEDSIVGKQLLPTGDDENYIHRHVFRKTLNGTWGEELNTTALAPEDQIKKYYSVTLDEAYNAEQCYIIAYVANTDTKEVLQVIEKKIK